MRIFAICVFSAAFAASMVVPRTSAAAGDAMAEVKATVDQVTSILKDPNYKSAPSERRATLRQLIASHFDFADMARSALGTHWKDLSDEQKNEFTQLFTQLMEASYTGKIESYTDQQVNFLQEISDNPGYAQVNTTITQEGKQPITVNYRLKQEDGSWKVYDVIIDGISLVANYRNQFSRVINTRGYDALIQDIRAKVGQIGGGSNDQ